MLTDELIDGFIKGESLAVAVEAITSQLDQLWQGAAAKNPALTRRGDFTLLVYSPHEGAYEAAAGVLTDFTRRHPCRIIAVIAAPEAEENEISVYLSAHVHAAEGKAVGSEQITLFAKGHTVEQLAASVTPLVLDTLPAILWWQGDLVEENILFEKLLAASRRLIFDSADGHDVGTTLSQARAVNFNWKDVLSADLNWRRLSPWRDLLTQFLDTTALLEHIVAVDLEVAAVVEGDAHFAKPFLLLGWLANRLNWKLNEPLTPLAAAPVDAGESVFQTAWQNQDKEVIGKITLRKAAAETEEITAAGGILTAKIRLQQEGDVVVFSAQSDWSPTQIRWQVVQGEKTLTESTVKFSHAAIADLLAQEMESTSRDADYEKALRFATQLI
ncbi:MAG: hypothetical protein ALAOOOJD_02331 [bacterium]|nr:hypothetical protein [bacterium]